MLSRGGSTLWLKMVIFLLIGIFGLVPLAQAKKKKTFNQEYQVFGFNDLGMHCYDKDFSVFSLLPPFNTIHAQVIRKKTLKPLILKNNGVQVTYQGDLSNRYGTDANGNVVQISTEPDSITTTSGMIPGTATPKTNFWDYVGYLFGAFGLQVDVGLTGTKMPNATFGPQSMILERKYKWFTAQGIPLNETDDNGNTNCFPLMKLQAFSPSGKSLSDRLDVVLPLSTEFRCAACHETDSWVGSDGYDWTNSDGSPPPRLVTDTFNADSFSQDQDFQVRFRKNILILHDYMNHTTLLSQAEAGQAVLCASCHYSKALDLSGQGPQGAQVGRTELSWAMHKHHGTTYPVGGGGMMGGDYVIPIPGEGVAQCYFCHPGNETQCLRSVMAGVVDPVTKQPLIQCQSCHGGLLSVGGYTPDLADPNKVAVYDANGMFQYYLFDLPADQLAIPLKTTGKQRQPWADMPKCQSCHSGDAVNIDPQLVRPFNQFVGTQAFTDANADSATPILAAASRFAENPDTLYRFSQTHGDVACASCHGSTHAEWPSRNPGNDNETAKQIQGHEGEISECNACHLSNLPPNQRGPHGLHNVNDRGWVALHGFFYAKNAQSCKACHGPDLKGTDFSKAKADRQFNYHGKIVNFAYNDPVNCYACHQTKNFKYKRH
jgi:hypothetical protein